ncbi:aminoglycoside phosphotransferase [Rheinheimera riviphila]|uniref:Aminoglycoside phosphotransferase n=1 Tax=Rheinheimera riviphila TaxID=1834037 RepID=A0A437QG27_9GAMM|nr:aminoglycoside phosphotransferase [Rheinheimera riviphila]
MTLICSFLSTVWPEHPYQLSAISGDASFRRYFRVHYQGKNYVLMDSPPMLEDGQRFVAVQQAFLASGLRVPLILQQDLAAGLLLLEDLGDQLLLDLLSSETADHWYPQALAELVKIRTITSTSQGPLPLFDRAFLLREMQLFIDWFVKVHLSLELSNDELAMLATLFDVLADAALEQPQAGMHRDYHARNLMVLANQQLAVIDFQDIVIGPVSYDAVSLLKDCYKRWPDEFVVQQRDEFFRQLQQSAVLDASWTRERFAKSFDLMGLQRHIKVCGIFSRLYHRDGKAGYLADLPRVLDYVIDAAVQYPECQAFCQLLQQKIQPRLLEVIACGQ